MKTILTGAAAAAAGAPQVDAGLVSMLESLLARARNGTVTSVGLVVVRRDGMVEPGARGPQTMQVYFGCDLLKQAIMGAAVAPMPTNAMAR